MAEEHVLELVKNVDARLARVEQILPTLSTREEVQAATARLATRDEMQAAIAEAVAPLPTRDEMHAAIAAAVAPLPSRDEMHAAIAAAVAPLSTREELHTAMHTLAEELRGEIKAEGERSRRYTDVLIEDLRDDNRLILEHLIALSARVDALAQR